MSTTVSSLFKFLTTPSTSTAATTYGAPTSDAFQAGLNGLGTQILQLQAQVSAAGASAAGNQAFIQTFNTIVGQVGQFQTSLTNAGAAVTNPTYQATINDLNTRLNAIKQTLTATPAAATPATTFGNDAFSAGLTGLGNQIVQLQVAVANAGASAAGNASFSSSYNTLANQLNAYATSLSNSGAAYAGSIYQAGIQDLSARMTQIRTALTAAPVVTTPSVPVYPTYPSYPTTTATPPFVAPGTVGTTGVNNVGNDIGNAINAIGSLVNGISGLFNGRH